MSEITSFLKNIPIKSASVLVFCFIAFLFPETASGKNRIGLVLSGGGAKGYAHIGVLKVLEREGISIDCITGTSMGSVIGALYSIGYKASDIEKIMTETDWKTLLADSVQRRNMPLRNRADSSRFLFSIDFKGYMPVIPKGLISGQNLENRLSSLTLPYHDYTDFSGLPIPFKCIATDAETGKAVVIEKGILAEAVRASMSIPSVFSPVEIDGKLLIDGGISRNFPVSDVKKMGAVTVIGVDAGQPLYKKENIDSFLKIMEQSMSYLGDESVKKERALCDLLILPDIEGYSSSDFDKADEIIKKGEEAAEKKLREIKALAAEIKTKSSSEIRLASLNRSNEIFINKINVMGLNKVSETAALSLLGLKPNTSITPDDAEEALRNLYGSGMFNKAKFRITSEGTMIIDTSEKTDHLLQIGLNYDSYLKGSLLAKLTLRNMLFMGNTFTIDATAAYDNPAVKASVFYYLFHSPATGLGIECESKRFDADTYTSSGDGRISGKYRILISAARLYLCTEFSNLLMFTAGAEKKLMTVNALTYPSDVEGKTTSESLAFYAETMIDNLDNAVFPGSGIFTRADARYILDILSSGKNDSFSPFAKYTILLKAALPLHGKLSAVADGSFGHISGEIIPLAELYFLGGSHSDTLNMIPFSGLNFFEVSARNFFTASLAISAELFDDFYIIPKYSYGRSADEAGGLKRKDNVYHGYSLTFGLDKFNIPAELTFSHGRGTRKNRLITYISLGYRF